MSASTVRKLHSLHSEPHRQSGDRGGICTHVVPLCRRMPRCSATRFCFIHRQHFGVSYRSRTGPSRLTISRARRHTQFTANLFWSDGKELNLHLLRIRQKCSSAGTVGLELPPGIFGTAGLEPTSSWFQTRRSPRLSYVPPNLSRLLFWSERPDSNRRSPASDAGALAATLRSDTFAYSLGHPGVEPGRRVYKTRQCYRHIAPGALVRQCIPAAQAPKPVQGSCYVCNHSCDLPGQKKTFQGFGTLEGFVVVHKSFSS